MKIIIDFIKYHNAFPIILAVIILGAGAALAAKTELRQTIFPSQALLSPPAQKTDTKLLLSEDLKKFNFALRVDSIKEDKDFYYVAYSYRTLEVVDGVWKETRKTKTMDIAKALLGKRNLESYLSEQVGQVLDREMTYLSEAKLAINNKSMPEDSAKYASLVGKAVKKSDAGDKVSDNNVRSDSSKNAGQQSASDVVDVVENENSQAENTLSKEEMRQMIVEAVAEFLAVDTSMPDTGAPIIEDASETSAVP